ncbi:MAG: hypothetical protein ACI9OJ_003258 [Myxococcota bacterium]|jgi:hypothetical protein
MAAGASTPAGFCAVLLGFWMVSTSAGAACPTQGDGKVALEAGDFPRATAAFHSCLKSANSEVDRWHALNGLGLTDDLAGRPVRAALYYDAFLRESGRAATLSERWAKRRARVRVEKGRLEGAVLTDAAKSGGPGLVRIQSTPSGASVEIAEFRPPAGVTLATPLEIFLPPGTRRASLGHAGFLDAERRFEVAAGATRAVMVRLQAPQKPIPPVVVEVDRPTSAETAGWALIGSGAAALVTASILTGLAYGDLSELEDISDLPATDASLARHSELSDRVGAYELSYGVSYGVGAAAAVTGAILLATDAPVTSAATPIDGGVLWDLVGHF